MLRAANLVAICLSVGFVAALALTHRTGIPRYFYGLGLSYCLFAAGSMVEIEFALRSDTPASWRTVLLTLVAMCGVVTAVWAWVECRDP